MECGVQPEVTKTHGDFANIHPQHPHHISPGTPAPDLHSSLGHAMGGANGLNGETAAAPHAQLAALPQGALVWLLIPPAVTSHLALSDLECWLSSTGSRCSSSRSNLKRSQKACMSPRVLLDKSRARHPASIRETTRGRQSILVILQSPQWPDFDTHELLTACKRCLSPQIGASQVGLGASKLADLILLPWSCVRISPRT